MPVGNSLDYMGFQKPDAYTPYAAGAKTYGMGRPNPTSGPVDNQGYQERYVCSCPTERYLVENEEPAIR